MEKRVQTQVNLPKKNLSLAPIQSRLLQRKCACEGTRKVDGKCAECRANQLTLPRQPLNQAKPAAAVPPILDNESRSSGEPLDPTTRTFMERRFGHDFSRVRVHADSSAAASAQALKSRAFTINENIWLGQQQYSHKTAGRQLLAHELTHVVQQRRGRAIGLTETGQESPNGYEQEAKHSAGIVAAGGPANVRGIVRPGSLQLSPLTDELTIARSTGGKGRIFDILRARGPLSADVDLTRWLDTMFGPNTNPATVTDDRWLADQLIQYGSEPRWPLSALLERERRAHAPGHSWAPEAGNIEAAFSVGAGRTPIRAYYFPGTSNKRAMIVGGVHGSEAAGVEVVNMLLEQMRALGAAMPFYSVIIVPALFPENLARRRRSTPGQPDPNRQMPAVGSSAGTTDSMGRPIEPENLVLLDLVERFQPERIAMVHGSMGPYHVKGNIAWEQGAPSITSDPRPDAASIDEALALNMARRAAAGGARVPGNRLGTPNETARYPTSSAPHQPGVTFGQYGSHSAGSRPAMNVILIETFHNETVAETNERARSARRIELESLATVLKDIFLGPP